MASQTSKLPDGMDVVPVVQVRQQGTAIYESQAPLVDAHIKLKNNIFNTLRTTMNGTLALGAGVGVVSLSLAYFFAILNGFTDILKVFSEAWAAALTVQVLALAGLGVFGNLSRISLGEGSKEQS
jgi:hypothetical protein